MVFFSYRGSCCAPEMKKAISRVTTCLPDYSGIPDPSDLPGLCRGRGCFQEFPRKGHSEGPFRSRPLRRPIFFSFSIGKFGRKNDRLHRGIKCKRSGSGLFELVPIKNDQQDHQHNGKLRCIDHSQDKERIHKFLLSAPASK